MTKPSERMKQARLANATLKGFRLDRLKLQKIRPLRGLIGKLSGGQHLGVTPPAVSNDNTGLPNVKSSKGSQVAFNLLLVRPWVLVIGFWLVSMVSAGLALEGLISPKKLTMDVPAASAPVTPKDAFISVEPSADELAGQAVKPDAKTVPVAPAETNSTNFPAWPLGALVGTCAAGCLVMSRRRAMARMAAARSRSTLRNESRSRVRKVRLSSDQAGHSADAVKKLSDRKVVQVRATSRPAASKAAPGRPTAARLTAAVQPAARPLAPKVSQSKNRRQRSRQPALPQPTTRSRVLASQSARQAAPVSKPNHRRRLSFQVANRQTVVTVVPTNEAHPLDWDNGSLAHQLDVRPQRSAT